MREQSASEGTVATRVDDQDVNRPSGAVWPFALAVAAWLALVALNGWYGVVASAFVLVSALALWAGCRIWARILRRIADEGVEATLTDRHGPRMTPRTLERQVRR